MESTTLRMSQCSAVVLPVLTEHKKLVWVQSEKIDQQVVSTAELQEAFDRFPYLKSEETAALAQRCSMHQDQVKVWFMAQRLRYGISWEYEDICTVREMLMPRGTGERKKGVDEEDIPTKKMKNRWAEKNNFKEDESKGSGAKKKNNVKVGKQSVSKDRNRLQTRSNNMRAANDEDLFVVHLQKQNSDTSSMADRLPELLKRMKLSRTSPKVCETTGLEKEPVTDALLRGETANAGRDSADAPSAFARPSKSGSRAPPSQDNKKTGSQLAMMRAAFLQCQYPNAEHYTELAEVIGVPRKIVVQWFNDMRYYVKTAKPRWMSELQHRQTVAKIKDRQDST